MLKELRRELAPRQQAAVTAAHPILQPFLRKLQTRLWAEALASENYEDTAVADDLEKGLQVLQKEDPCAIFPTMLEEEPRLADWRQAMKEGAKVRDRIAGELAAHHPWHKELWKAGKEAEKRGSLGAAIPLHQTPDEAFVFKEFGVAQDRGDGTSKIRPCVNASSRGGGNHFNAMWWSSSKVTPSCAEVITAEASVIYLASGHPPWLAKEDLCHACEQCPRRIQVDGVRIRMFALFWCEGEVWAREL
eukprot:TRINITY_DN79792_c0_g1_i1.p1 TRINITY_DN79792_c0_g1~~TRINITY_DN79792_c0_g1_i1.p1  ORF type:complete len:247 (-),score=45.37 TRINITY_DN79792_c0_g1_i1:16-756(-)